MYRMFYTPRGRIPVSHNDFTPRAYPHAFRSGGDYLAPALGLAAGAYAARRAYRRSTATNRRLRNASLNAAPLTIGMNVGPSSKSVSEGSKMDSKIVSAQEVIFDSVASTNDNYSGGSQQYEMAVAPLDPRLKVLSQEAASFQLYRFTKLQLQFETSVNSTISGAIILGALNDVTDDSPANYTDASLLQTFKQCNVWTPCTLNIPCHKQWFYVSSSTDVTFAEVRQLIQVKIFYALLNTAIGSGPVGAVKLNYTCELSRRISPVALTSFDAAALGFTVSDDPLASIPSIVRVKASPWYQRLGFNADTGLDQLLIKARGTYVVSFTLTSTIDEDVTTAGASIIPYDQENNPITLTTNYAYASYSATTNMHKDIYSAMLVFTVPDNASYFDFSGLSALTGPLNVNFQSDVVN